MLCPNARPTPAPTLVQSEPAAPRLDALAALREQLEREDEGEEDRTAHDARIELAMSPQSGAFDAARVAAGEGDTAPVKRSRFTGKKRACRDGV